MKGLNKTTKSKEVKNKNENGKETETQGSSTPEISARSRQSLDGLTAQREDEREIQILQLQALLQEQSQQLEETQQALRYSQTERQETSQAFAEVPKALEQRPADARTKYKQTKTSKATRYSISGRP